jgi:hypothetical protein
MKTLPVNTGLKDPRKRTIRDRPTKEELSRNPQAEGEPTLLKDIFMQYLDIYGAGEKGVKPKKLIRARRLSEKMYDTPLGDLEVEDAEFELLEEAMANPLHGAAIMGLVWEIMEEAKDKGGKKPDTASTSPTPSSPSEENTSHTD